MPVVISLLNSFTGVAAAMGGFLYDNQSMLTGGILVGSAGTILTILMCKAMNRSLLNVIIGAFGGDAASVGDGELGTVKEISVSDAAVLLRHHAQMPSEGAPHPLGVPKARITRDLIEALAFLFQHHARSLDARSLDELGRRDAKGAPKDSREVSLAHGRARGEGGHPEVAIQVAQNPVAQIREVARRLAGPGLRRQVGTELGLTARSPS